MSGGAGLAQIRVGTEHAAHEFHELGGPGRGVQGVGQSVYFVLDRPDKEFTEALVGKSGVFEGVSDLVTLGDDATQLLVHILKALGGRRVCATLALEDTLQVS